MLPDSLDFRDMAVLTLPLTSEACQAGCFSSGSCGRGCERGRSENVRWEVNLRCLQVD